MQLVVFDIDGTLTNTNLEDGKCYWRAWIGEQRETVHLFVAIIRGYTSAANCPACAVVRTAVRKTDSRSMWVNELLQRRSYNRATVAVANKNARVIWAVLTSGEPYRAAA